MVKDKINNREKQRWIGNINNEKNNINRTKQKTFV